MFVAKAKLTRKGFSGSVANNCFRVVLEEQEKASGRGDFSLSVGKDRGKVKTCRSQAELDLTKENKANTAQSCCKQVILKQGKNYEGCGIPGGEGCGRHRD